MRFNSQQNSATCFSGMALLLGLKYSPNQISDTALKLPLKRLLLSTVFTKDLRSSYGRVGEGTVPSQTSPPSQVNPVLRLFKWEDYHDGYMITFHPQTTFDRFDDLVSRVKSNWCICSASLVSELDFTGGMILKLICLLAKGWSSCNLKMCPSGRATSLS